MNFPSQIFFNDINHDYRAVISRKNSLWLLPFYMIEATYFDYEKMRRTMRTAIASNFLQDLICWSSLKNWTTNNTRQHDTTRDNTSRTRHNTSRTRGNPRRHEYNATQHEYSTTQHEYKGSSSSKNRAVHFTFCHWTIYFLNFFLK